MPRKSRIIGDSGIYHVILRGNNKQILFYSDDDKKFLLTKLKKYADEQDISLYSFCIMDNHIHILIGNASANMAVFVKKLCCSYAYYFNHKYDHCGHVFNGRYLSEPVEDIQYFKDVFKYILLNPQKALISDYKNYRWNSYKEIMEGNKCIDSEFLMNIFKTKENIKYITEMDICNPVMEYNYSNKNSDSLKLEFITQLFEINDLLSTPKDPPKLQKKKIIFLRQHGLTPKQISRVTGLALNIVYHCTLFA